MREDSLLNPTIETDEEITLRPKRLDEFIGQDRVGSVWRSLWTLRVRRSAPWIMSCSRDLPDSGRRRSPESSPTS